MKQAVRVRFAPSPTGLLHIGGVRTALFNYLFAKKNDGQFILRLEDTDRERFEKKSVDHIQAGLHWLGLVPDEGCWLGKHKGQFGPYIQSQRLPHYREFAQRLVDKDLAYYSRISTTEFTTRRDATILAKKPFVYRHEFEPADDGKTQGYPIRLKIQPGVTTWSDEIRGKFTSEHKLIDDFIIVKADGFPTYNFASVVDDHLMKISDVLRADEFIASTAKHCILYDNFKWNRPKFIHLPAILGPNGTRKLSKRDGDSDVLNYQRQGYLPEALLNFLVLLGWNSGEEKEIFELSELIEKFTLQRLGKSPAIFDHKKLDWINGYYIRRLSLGQLADALKPFVSKKWYADPAYLKKVLALDQARLKKLSDATELMDFFFTPPQVKRQLLIAKDSAKLVKGWLEQAAAVLEKTSLNHVKLEQALRALADQLGVKASQLFYVMRVAVTGRTEAPGLFETIIVLGLETTMKRLQKAASRL